MTASPIASDAMIATALTVTGLSSIPRNRQQLLQGIATAFANRNASGGDPATNTYTALGDANLANNDQALLQQVFILSATT